MFSVALVQQSERSADSAAAGELMPLLEAHGQFAVS